MARGTTGRRIVPRNVQNADRANPVKGQISNRQQPPQNLAKKCVGNYILGKTIGQGTFGKVKAGLHLITGERVAIKLLEKSRIKQAADVERVTREIRILKRNRHRNIIQLFEVVDSEKTIYLIMEYADGGEMFDYIVAHQRIPEHEAVRLFHQVVDGLEYLHNMEVTHRDLKPENLLLQTSHDGWVIKIVDFGLSNTHDGGRLLKTACGSPCYAAPEMIAGKKYAGPMADMWSLGVILFAMICGFLPFEDDNTNMLYKKILAGDFQIPVFISASARDLICRILEVDPEKRYTIPHIRKHPWCSKIQLKIPEPLDEPEQWSTNELVISQIEDHGIDRASLIRDLENKRHTSQTASYFLMLNKLNRGDTSTFKPTTGSDAVKPADILKSDRPIATNGVRVTQPTIPALNLSSLNPINRQRKRNPKLIADLSPYRSSTMRDNGVIVRSRPRPLQTARISAVKKKVPVPTAPKTARHQRIVNTSSARVKSRRQFVSDTNPQKESCWNHPQLGGIHL